VQSSRDHTELGWSLTVAPRSWQGQDSLEGAGAEGRVCGGRDGAMPRGCAGRAVLQRCMGLCAELERPHFAANGELTAACATPWSLSPCELHFKIRQKKRTPSRCCWISHC